MSNEYLEACQRIQAEKVQCEILAELKVQTAAIIHATRIAAEIAGMQAHNAECHNNHVRGGYFQHDFDKLVKGNNAEPDLRTKSDFDNLVKGNNGKV